MDRNTTMIATDTPAVLNRTQLDEFADLGYTLLPGFLPDDLVSRLKPEVDRWVDTGLRAKAVAACLDPETHGLPPVLELELEGHGELISYPPLMAALTQLMGPEFVFHHLHSDRHDPGLAGKPWHHDYEAPPAAGSRPRIMVHALHYLDGLDEDTAALVILPRSHREIAEKASRAHLGTDELPGEVVIERLPRGSTVVAHSAVFHARRPKSDAAGRPRYFVDASYCQAGVLWPPVKPFWRYMLGRGRELGLDRGEWPELFAEHHFTEYVKPS
jgi:hypothetical protein